MEGEGSRVIGPHTIVFDSENDNAPFFLGNAVPVFRPTRRIRTRIDQSWWLTDLDGEPIRDECGRARQVARFEIGQDCRYRLNPMHTSQKLKIRPPGISEE